MQTQMQKMLAMVYSVQISQAPDGTRHTKTFIGMQPDENEQTKGISLVSISTDPAVYDSLTVKQFPAVCEIDYVMLRGGQNKMKQHVVGIRQTQQQSPAASAKA